MIALVGYVAIVAFPPLVAYCKLEWPRSDCVTLLQSLAVVVTGVVVMWYAWETAELRHAANRQVEATLSQRELSLRPFVTFDYSALTVTNQGYGPALDVRLDDLVVVRAGGMGDVVITFPGAVSFLAKGEGREIRACLGDKQLRPSDFLIAVMGEKIERDYTMTIRYRDLENRTYTTVRRVIDQVLTLETARA